MMPLILSEHLQDLMVRYQHLPKQVGTQMNHKPSLLKIARMLIFLLVMNSCGFDTGMSYYQSSSHDVAQIKFAYPSNWKISVLRETDTSQSIHIEELGVNTPDPKMSQGLPRGYINIYAEKSLPSGLLKTQEMVMEFNFKDHIR